MQVVIVETLTDKTGPLWHVSKEQDPTDNEIHDYGEIQTPCQLLPSDQTWQRSTMPVYCRRRYCLLADDIWHLEVYDDKNFVCLGNWDYYKIC